MIVTHQPLFWQIRVLLLSIFVVVVANAALSADGRRDDVPADSAAVRYPLAFTLAGGLSMESFIDQYALHAEGRAGVILGESFLLEGYYRSMMDRFSKQVIFPEVYQLRLWTAGASARYDFVSAKRYSVFAALNGGVGRASWHPTEQRSETFTDVIFQTAPEAGASWKVWPFLAVECAVRYNAVFDLELVGLESNALEGLAVGVRLRLINWHRA